MWNWHYTCSERCPNWGSVLLHIYHAWWPLKPLNNDQGPAKSSNNDQGPPKSSSNYRAPANSSNNDQSPPKSSSNYRGPPELEQWSMSTKELEQLSRSTKELDRWSKSTKELEQFPRPTKDSTPRCTKELHWTTNEVHQSAKNSRRGPGKMSIRIVHQRARAVIEVHKTALTGDEIQEWGPERTDHQTAPWALKRGQPKNGRRGPRNTSKRDRSAKSTTEHHEIKEL